MEISNIIELCAQQVSKTPWLEWIAIIAAVAEVLLARKNSILLYPAGIISTAIYTWLFMRPQTKLYADALLNVYYFSMSIYGWVIWNRKLTGRTLAISKLSLSEWVFTIMLVVVAWLTLLFLLLKVFPIMFAGYIPSDVAVWDALVSGAAWVGMWLLAKRKLENWLVLNFSNFLAIPLLIYKGMPFTAGLTIFLFIVALYGYRSWNRIYLATSVSR